MQFAFIISRLLDPLWIIPAITLLKAYNQGVLFSFVLMIIMLGIPLILRFRYRKHDWDVSKREDRPNVIAALLILGCMTIIFARIFGNTAIMKLLIFYEIWLFGFFLLSLFFKISGHAGGISLATGLIVSWYGFAWWPVLLIVPLVAWARVKRRDHTIPQVIMGGLYSWVLLVVFDYWIIR